MLLENVQALFWRQKEGNNHGANSRQRISGFETPSLAITTAESLKTGEGFFETAGVASPAGRNDRRGAKKNLPGELRFAVSTFQMPAGYRPN
jgi:hypothetical protein